VDQEFSDSRGERPRRRSRRRRMPAPRWARFTILALLGVLFGTLGWQGLGNFFHAARKSPDAAAASAEVRPAPIPWQVDVTSSLESALLAGQAGDITQAEVAVDRAGSFLVAARIESKTAAPEFFTVTIGGLDRALRTHPNNSRLFEHATLTRIELEELRSSMEIAPALDASVAGSSAADDPSAGAGKAGRVVVASPRTIAANHTLDAASLGGVYLDATLMPDTAEILLPPATRLFVDNVRVENLILAGAAQTLDGIHWHNVTFIGTRLRYEGGDLSLQNIHFVRCTFGFPADHRGAQIATAIALGQSSFAIQ
jgi:hypothetical protein